jgi:hypothetical protein
MHIIPYKQTSIQSPTCSPCLETYLTPCNFPTYSLSELCSILLEKVDYARFYARIPSKNPLFTHFTKKNIFYPLYFLPFFQEGLNLISLEEDHLKIIAGIHYSHFSLCASETGPLSSLQLAARLY